jgi:hypothetical protein
VKSIGTVEVDEDVEVINGEAETKIAVEATNSTGTDPMMRPISRLDPFLAMKGGSGRAVLESLRES